MIDGASTESATSLDDLKTLEIALNFGLFQCPPKHMKKHTPVFLAAKDSKRNTAIHPLSENRPCDVWEWEPRSWECQAEPNWKVWGLRSDLRPVFACHRPCHAWVWKNGENPGEFNDFFRVKPEDFHGCPCHCFTTWCLDQQQTTGCWLTVRSGLSGLPPSDLGPKSWLLKTAKRATSDPKVGKCKKPHGPVVPFFAQYLQFFIFILFFGETNHSKKMRKIWKT